MKILCFNILLNVFFIFFFILKQGCSKSIGKLLYDSCKSFFNAFFIIDEKRIGSVLNSMEFFCTNDCYKRFKNSYELVTNYDIDEFIFPRKTRTNNLSSYDASKLAKCNPSTSLYPPPSQYSSYDYFMKLIDEQSKKYKRKIAAIKFENLWILTTVDESFFDFLFSVNIRWVNVTYRNGLIRLRVEKKDEAAINAIFNAQHVVKCLNESVLGNGRFDSKWNSPYSMFMGDGREKSVFNTNYTEFINQHESDLITPESVAIDLGLEDGYSSHFRDDLIDWFKGDTFPFSYFQMDLEYYFFLNNLSKK